MDINDAWRALISVGFGLPTEFRLRQVVCHKFKIRSKIAGPWEFDGHADAYLCPDRGSHESGASVLRVAPGSKGGFWLIGLTVLGKGEPRHFDDAEAAKAYGITVLRELGWLVLDRQPCTDCGDLCDGGKSCPGIPF